MSWLLSAPLIISFLAAVVAFALRRRPVGRLVPVAASLALCGVSAAILLRVHREGVIAAQIGNWPAPFGITFVADLLSAMMLVITAVIALAVSVYSLAEIDADRARRGYDSFMMMLVGGVSGAFVTGDIFNLYVWFEVMLISSFGLLTIGGSRREIDGGIKYVVLNLISTALFLCAAGLLYGATGTLNMADLRGVVGNGDPGVIGVVAILLMFAYGMKAAVFPLFFWLPAAYHTPSYSVSALFSALLTKVGVYALMRVFTLIFVGDTAFTHTILLWVGVLTMFTGVIGAAAQGRFRNVLSFHIISQIGYMIVGLALLTPLALAGAIFYVIHHIIVKANLFLVAGVARRLSGSADLYRTGGLYAAAPLLSLLFLIPAFSLAGFPPLSGFWAKLIVVRAAFESGEWAVAAVALLVGLLTIFSMVKIWGEAFLKPAPEGQQIRHEALPPLHRGLMFGPVAALAAVTLYFGLAPAALFDLSMRAADQLIAPDAYLAAVLIAGGVP